MEKGKMRRVMVTVLIVWLATVIGETEAQGTCEQTLIPCADYLNATHPPATCCSPLKDALANQKECMCGIFNSPDLLKAFHINVTDALSLPARCNLTTGASSNICAAATSPSPSATSNSTSTSPTASGNAAAVVAWSGVSAILAATASLILY